jgi:hypothetical protein
MHEQRENLMPSIHETSLIRSSILWGLMAVSLVLSLVLAYLLNIRFDEAFTLNTTSQGVAYAFRQAITFEQQAPLYFVILSIWRNIDSSVIFARLFSVLCFPLFVWIVAEVGKRYVKGVNPLVFAAVAVVHQQTVWSSLDIRLYSLMLVFSGLLLLFFYDGYLAEKPKTRSRVLYVIVSILALYTQYYLGFQLVAGAAALLVLGRWRALSRYLLDMLVVGLFFIPMLFVIKQQFTEVSGHTEVALSVSELIKGTYQRITPLFISVDWLEPETLKRWLARGAALFIAALFCWQIARKRKPEDVALGIFIVVLLGFFFFTYSLLGEQGIQHRHMSGLLLPLLLVTFSALTSLSSKKLIYGWLVLLIFLNVGYLYVAYKPLAKPGDFIRVAQYVMTNEAANQPVLVFHADAILPLEQYYRGENTLVALPQKSNFIVWDPRNNVLKDETQILDIIDNQPGNPERFWLVHDGWCKHGSLSFNCQVLEDVVTKYFEVESTKSFFEPVTVRLLRRK